MDSNSPSIKELKYKSKALCNSNEANSKIINITDNNINNNSESEEHNTIENPNNNSDTNSDSDSNSDSNSDKKIKKESKENKFERILEYVFDKFSMGVRIIGPIFAFALTTFVFVVAHTFFNIILMYWENKFGFLIKIPLGLMAIYILFSILFNYFLACLVRPGCLEDLKTSKYYRKNDPLNAVSEEIDLSNLLKNPNNMMQIDVDNSNNTEDNILINDTNNINTVDRLEIKLKLNISNQNKNNTSINNCNIHEASDLLYSTNKNSNGNNNHSNNHSNNNDDNNNNNNNLIDGQSTAELFKEIDNQLGFEDDSEIPSINLLDKEYNLKIPKNNQDYEAIRQNNKILHEMKENKAKEEEIERYYKDKVMEETHDKLQEQLKDCKNCKVPKIVRSHHCQICGYCVFKMDHHCPWINNCVGLNNHRYFILFLTHIFLGTVFINITASPISFSSIKKPVEFTFVTVLCLVGMLILIFFNSWNWFLVLRGNTTIEFWMFKTKSNTKNVIKDFGFNDWRDNIYIVFGTRSLLEAIFIPSYKRLPFSGVEWTKLEYKDFTYDFGELKKEDVALINNNNDEDV